MGNHYVRRFDLSKYTLKSFDSANEFACDTNNGDAWTVDKNGTQAVLQDSTSALATSSPIQISGATAAGAALSAYSLVKTITAIADDTATTLFTVTVPNPTVFNTAVIDLTVLAIAGAGGAIGAGESCAAAFYQIVVTRTAGVAAVAGISTAASATAAVAAVSGGDQIVSPATQALVSLGAVSGGATASETFTIQVTIDDDTGSATNHSCVAYATLLNVNASGVTIA